MEQRGIFLRIKPHKPTAYFAYSEDCVVQSRSKRTADTPQTLFEDVQIKKCIALQTRLGAMRYMKVSHLCIFSYDGTDRIRFAGQGYGA